MDNATVITITTHLYTTKLDIDELFKDPFNVLDNDILNNYSINTKANIYDYLMFIEDVESDFTLNGYEHITESFNRKRYIFVHKDTSKTFDIRYEVCADITSPFIMKSKLRGKTDFDMHHIMMNGIEYSTYGDIEHELFLLRHKIIK